MPRGVYERTPAVREMRKGMRPGESIHGARSASQIERVARNHKRRFMRQMGKKIGDLDGIAAAYVDGWSKAHAVVSILADHYSLNGVIRGSNENGEPDPSLRTFFSGLNSERLILSRLADHLARYGDGGEADLDTYIIEQYGADGDDADD